MLILLSAIFFKFFQVYNLFLDRSFRESSSLSVMLVQFVKCSLQKITSLLLLTLRRGSKNDLRSLTKKWSYSVVGFIGFYFEDPQCHLKSFEREQCGELKSPFITPDKCIKAGCCYDDMFMDEPSIQWHNQNASIWCFKMKNILSKSK